jgi:uncharacterized protein YcfL
VQLASGDPVNDEQTLVMESSVLAAGITAQQPALTISEIRHLPPLRSLTKDMNR